MTINTGDGLLRIDHQHGICAVTLTRADKRNALSADLVEALIAAVDQAHAGQARVLSFRGEGKNFCAGFDFSDFDRQSEGDLVLRFIRIETLLQAIAGSPCLTVAFAQGRNFGAGVDLFAACRQRIATANASFRMPGLKFGLVLGTRRFGQIVGAERAAQIQQESITFDAEQARAMGFVHQLAEPEAWAGLVAQASTHALALEDHSRADLYRVLASARPDTDLASLVRSATRPGLKQRIARYLQAD